VLETSQESREIHVCLSRKRDVRAELCSIMNGGCEVPKVHCGG
jgi:hypothetical protein